MNIPIVYEDDWLLIIDKPSGLLVIPTPKNEKRTLTSILNQDLEKRGISYRLHPCHRLDRETSGLMIYAKGKSIQKRMMDLFKERKVYKNYVAFIRDRLKQPSGQINNSIEGLRAVTKYEVIEQRDGFAIVRAQPLTGRTNQIRIHFKQIGHPIMGETKYAFRKDFKLKAKRLCLHAESLNFIHPVTAKPVDVSSALPEDLNEFLKKYG